MIRKAWAKWLFETKKIKVHDLALYDRIENWNLSKKRIWLQIWKRNFSMKRNTRKLIQR